jgi:hypothetical protein
MTSITASTTTTGTNTTTSVVLEQQQRQQQQQQRQQQQFIQQNHNSFPIQLKSKKLYEQGQRFQKQQCYTKAIHKYLRGAEMTGCLHCIFDYIELIRFVHKNKSNNKNSTTTTTTTTTTSTINHLILPWLLEGAIRGHLYSIIRLYLSCYTEALPSQAHALIEYWLKIEQSLYPSLDDNQNNNTNNNNKNTSTSTNTNTGTIKDGRQKAKKTVVSCCPICYKTDDDCCGDNEDDSTSNDNVNGNGNDGGISTSTGITKANTKTTTKKVSKGLKQCMGCQMYCYFSEECQTTHWIKQNHRNECKMIQLLQKYHKPYSKEIYQTSIQQQQPKQQQSSSSFGSIDNSKNRLQILREKLGLNRPKIDYEELILLLSSDNDNNDNKNDNNDSNDNNDDRRRRHYLVARPDGTVHIGSTPNVI